jgi:hypothetical protein
MRIHRSSAKAYRMNRHDPALRHRDINKKRPEGPLIGQDKPALPLHASGAARLFVNVRGRGKTNERSQLSLPRSCFD